MWGLVVVWCILLHWTVWSGKDKEWLVRVICKIMYVQNNFLPWILILWTSIVCTGDQAWSRDEVGFECGRHHHWYAGRIKNGRWVCNHLRVNMMLQTISYLHITVSPCKWCGLSARMVDGVERLVWELWWVEPRSIGWFKTCQGKIKSSNKTCR